MVATRLCSFVLVNTLRDICVNAGLDIIVHKIMRCTIMALKTVESVR